MTLIKQKHQQVVEEKVGELIVDLGKAMKVHLRSELVDCPWCIFSHELQKSTGKPQPGKDWSTHPNYPKMGTNLICPNCLGKGRIDENEIILVENVIVSEIKGMTLVNGKPAIMPTGSIKVTGNIADVDSNKVVTYANNEYATIAHANQSGLDITTGDVVLEAWVKVDSGVVGDRIIMQKFSSNAGYKFLVNGENLSVIVGDGTDTSTTTTNLDAGTLVDNDWHHVVAVIDKSSSATIYIDGSAITAYSSQEVLTDVDSLANSGAFYIAGETTTNSLIGSLDELRVWDFDTNGLPADITTIINQHYRYAHTIYKTADEDYLKGWWVMEELT